MDVMVRQGRIGSPSGPAGKVPPPRPHEGHRGRLAVLLARHERISFLAAGLVLAFAGSLVTLLLSPHPQKITQKDIDAAVLYTLESLPRDPSPAAVASGIVGPSVVRVSRLSGTGEGATEEGVGTGVVVEEGGTILTCLHVVAGARRIAIRFADGTDADAALVGVVAENDLAVLAPSVVPDDLIPATLRSTAGLHPGDRVVAVGHPFGIGPSVSAGVISGLGRAYFSPEGKRLLTNLIQFDAAVNPGNSGGPLVTEEGEVVGIVSAILNPTEQRVFIGIGFAVPIETAMGGIGISPF